MCFAVFCTQTQKTVFIICKYHSYVVCLPHNFNSGKITLSFSLFRLQMKFSVSDALTEGTPALNLSSFYVLVTKPESDTEQLGVFH